MNDKRLACGVLLIAMGVALPAAADQFVALDVTYTATSQNTTDSHYPVDPKAGIPANWRSPVDYASGNAYVQLDILEKPSAAKTLYNICFENSSNYACMPYPPTPYTAVGRVDFSGAFSAFYQYSAVDWTKGVSKIQLILKDEKEVKPQGSPDFYPTKVHVIITIVAPGSTYVPPGNSQAGSGGGGAAAGGRSGTAGASAGSMSTAGIGGRSANAGNGSARAGAAATAGKGGTKADSGAPASAPQAGRMSGSSGTVANSQAGAKGGVAGIDSEGGGGRSVSSLLHTNGGCSVTNASGGSMRWSPLVALGLALAVRRRRLRRSR